MMTANNALILINGCDFIEAPDFRIESSGEKLSVINSYSINCDLKPAPRDKKQLIGISKGLDYAERLREELNDLIEEYHAPGNTRRERRAVKRQFDKVARIFCDYCKRHNIEINIGPK